VADVPLYDPDVHLEPDEVVRVEMWCRCTGVHRQVDPLEYCRPFIHAFAERHSGPGHGPVDPAEAVEEREARREAAFRATGRQDEYEAKEYDTPDVPAWDWSKVG